MIRSWFPMLTMAAALAACGGVVDVADAPAAPAAAHGPAAAQRASSAHGSRAVPAPAARTAARAPARFSSVQEADALEAELGNRAIRVDVGCCDAGATDMAVMMAFVSQVAYDLPNSAPVLVRGGDPQAVLAVAGRLSDAGLSDVRVVLQ